MALTLIINQEYKDQRMSTEAGFTALGDMTQTELLHIALQAAKSHNPILTQCFKDLPSLADLQSAKVALEQATVIPPVEAVVPVVKPAKPVKTKEQIVEEVKQANETLADDADLLNSLP